jgi:hypothetical protein
VNVSCETLASQRGSKFFGASKIPSFACASEIVSCETFTHPMFRSLLPFNQSPVAVHYSPLAIRYSLSFYQSPIASRHSPPLSPSFSHASRIVSHETLHLKAGF